MALLSPPTPPTEGLRAATWRSALAACALWAAPGPGARAQGALEFAVKANYLYKIAPFVTWPARAFRTAVAPFEICVIGEDPFGRVLDDAVQGQRMGDHPIVVRRLATATAGMNCHVLYAGRSAAQTTADMLQAVAGEPVLTITDQGPGAAAGMVEFIMQGGRVRFAINAAAAEATGMVISSKLLALALSVRR